MKNSLPELALCLSAELATEAGLGRSHGRCLSLPPPMSVLTMQSKGVGHRRAKTKLFDCRTKAASPHQHSVKAWLNIAEDLPLQLSWCLLLSAVLKW